MNDVTEKLIDVARRAGALGERDRILGEILKMDLPPGVWFLIKPAFNPADEKVVSVPNQQGAQTAQNVPTEDKE